MKPLRVIVLAPDPSEVGGIQRATRTLLTALESHFGRNSIRLVPLASATTAATHSLSTVAEKALRVLPFVHRSLQAALAWRSRTVVLACHPHIAPVAWLCRLIAGTPYVVWAHGTDVWTPLPWAERYALATANALFAPSRFTALQAETLLGLSSGHVSVIPHCIPTELHASAVNADGRRVEPSTSGGHVLTVARLDPDHAYKGIDVLLRGWPLVRARCPDAKLVIAGEGEDRSRLAQLVDDVKADGVQFLGHISDEALADAYREAVCFALPSRCRVGRQPEGEGFGLVFLEAAIHGVPVLGGRAGAIPEVVVDGETGLLVDPHDPRDVAEKLSRILLNPSWARRLGERGRRRALEEFSFERFQRQVVTLLEEIRSPPQNHTDSLWRALTRLSASTRSRP